MERTNADMSALQFSRRIRLKRSWRRETFTFNFDGNVVPVVAPLLRVNTRPGKLLEFQLASGDVVVVNKDVVDSASIQLNEREVARVTPIASESPVRFGHRTYRLQIATVSLHKVDLPVVCSVYLGVASNHFRILSENGSRWCYWRKTGGWGPGCDAELVIARRVSRDCSLVAIAVAASMLLED